jgi:GDP-L-fucose synthase
MSYWDNKEILVTGGSGFLGSFVVEKLSQNGVLRKNIRVPRSSSCDLRIFENCQRAVSNRDLVIHLAASLGGIEYNRNYPGTLFYDNSIMGIQLMEAARLEGVDKFVVIGSVCSYPKEVPIPTKEEHLWVGYPEESNAAYGLSKKMLLVQAQAYKQEFDFNAIFLLLANMYGPRDNFDLQKSHVIPALIRKMLEAERKSENVVLWGTGKATRDFLYVEDAAEAILLATEEYDDSEPLNIASGSEISIKDLASLIQGLTGYTREIVWDTSKPDGQPRRLFDITRARSEIGFEAKTSLEEGLRRTVEWYLENAV